MEEEWWNSKETDHATADDSGSDMNTEPLRPSHDKDFTSDPASVIAVFAISLFFALPVIICGGFGIVMTVYSIEPPFQDEPDWIGIGLGIFASLFGLLAILLYRNVLFRIISVHRLRVQHSTDLLVFDSTYRGREFHSEERRLSEAAYLEYRETTSRTTDSHGDSTKYTSITAIVHGRSSEEEVWKLSIGALIRKFQNKQKKALEIADAIGIELEVRIRR